jgi:hypothetical protein
MIHAIDVLAGFAVFAATATPAPVPAFDGDVNLVTPGVIGFAVTFLIAAATVALVVDMTRRVRRVRYREQVNAELDAEQLAALEADELSAGDSGPAERA